jgi:purine-nucleoside phosphorylase
MIEPLYWEQSNNLRKEEKMFVNKNMDRNDVLTDPARLVRLELENAGYDMDGIHIPKRVFLLADSLYDTMLSRNCGEYRYPLGGKLFVFHGNEETGFIKGHMCSPAIATQAEDLIAGGVEELIHIGFAGGLQTDLKPGDIVLTDGAYNDTAVARLYGFDKDFIGSTKTLTDELGEHLTKNAISFRRGKHWTTDAGYHETWGQIMDYREKGALCVEMEGVGLFTIANYRKCAASAVYVISDVIGGNSWELGWSESALDASVEKMIDWILSAHWKAL